jgi:hypothetical protein
VKFKNKEPPDKHPKVKLWNLKEKTFVVYINRKKDKDKKSEQSDNINLRWILAKEKYFLERIRNESKDDILYIKDNHLRKKVKYKWKQKDNPNYQLKLSFPKKFKYVI